MERFNIRTPHDFVYADHPFIDHKKSDYSVLPDSEAGKGWKVVRSAPTPEEASDVAYFTHLDDCFGFVRHITHNTQVELSDDAHWAGVDSERMTRQIVLNYIGRGINGTVNGKRPQLGAR